MLSIKFYNILVFFLLVAAHTALFWLSDIDLRVASLFYDPQQANPWPLGDVAIWKTFYQLGEVITLSLVVSTLLIMVLSEMDGKQ